MKQSVLAFSWEGEVFCFNKCEMFSNSLCCRILPKGGRIRGLPSVCTGKISNETFHNANSSGRWL